MNAEDFVARLRDAMPSQESLADYGLDDEEIDAIQLTFIAKPRDQVQSTQESNHEIQRLIRDFDCSTVEIGLVRFCNEFAHLQSGERFAFCEADSVLLRKDGAVALYAHSAPDSLLLECAADSERFLDALAEFVEVQKKKRDWEGRVQEAAIRCATAAGGEKYLDFYRLLCAFLETPK